MAGAETLSRPSRTPRSLGSRDWGWRMGCAGAPGDLPSEGEGIRVPHIQPPGRRQLHGAGPRPPRSWNLAFPFCGMGTIMLPCLRVF